MAKTKEDSDQKAARPFKRHHAEFLEGQFPDPKTVGDYLSVARTLSTLPWAITSSLVRNAVATNGRRKAHRDVVLESVMGHCYRESTLRQLRILTPVKPLKKELGSLLYAMPSRGLPGYNREFSGDGFRARWISQVPDRKPHDPVILYMHGGGYALKTCQPQVAYICDLAKALLPHRVSIILLDYAITPFFKFPTQRNEAIACIRKLHTETKNIILFGDSCGANLALTSLLEEELWKERRAFGVALVSPWVDLVTQEGSMNSSRDILSKKRLNEMSANFAPVEYFNDPRVSPLNAEKESWERVLPPNTCMVWGELECLADQVSSFRHKAQVHNVFVESNGTHDCILRGLDPKPCRFVTEQLIGWADAVNPDIVDSKGSLRSERRREAEQWVADATSVTSAEDSMKADSTATSVKGTDPPAVVTAAASLLLTSNVLTSSA